VGREILVARLKKEAFVTDEQRIRVLEHRVRELQSAVVGIVKHLGIEHDLAASERTRLDDIRLTGDVDAPTERLIGQYSEPRHSVAAPRRRLSFAKRSGPCVFAGDRPATRAGSASAAWCDQPARVVR
jgi:hypothetical protein